MQNTALGMAPIAMHAYRDLLFAEGCKSIDDHVQGQLISCAQVDPVTEIMPVGDAVCHQLNVSG